MQLSGIANNAKGSDPGSVPLSRRTPQGFGRKRPAPSGAPLPRPARSGSGGGSRRRDQQRNQGDEDENEKKDGAGSHVLVGNYDAGIAVRPGQHDGGPGAGGAAMIDDQTAEAAPPNDLPALGGALPHQAWLGGQRIEVAAGFRLSHRWGGRLAAALMCQGAGRENWLKGATCDEHHHDRP